MVFMPSDLDWITLSGFWVFHLAWLTTACGTIRPPLFHKPIPTKNLLLHISVYISLAPFLWRTLIQSCSQSGSDEWVQTLRSHAQKWALAKNTVDVELWLLNNQRPKLFKIQSTVLEKFPLSTACQILTFSPLTSFYFLLSERAEFFLKKRRRYTEYRC